MAIWTRIRGAVSHGAPDGVVGSTTEDEVDAASSQAEVDEVLHPDEYVPHGVRVAASWAWSMILIAALIALVYWIVTFFSEVTIPLFVAVLLTAALTPLKNWLVDHGVPRGIAVALSLLALVVVVGGILGLVGAQIASQWQLLRHEAVNSFNQLLDWLAASPLHVTDTNIDTWIQSARDWVNNSSAAITKYATSIGVGVGHFFAGLALALFALVYFLLEGSVLARAASVLVPRRSRSRIMGSAVHGWKAMVSYVRAAVTVAAVDGLGSLIGAAALGSSMWLAIGALTFLCAFIPIVGAIVAGTVATAVVLVTLGWVKAVVMLVVYIAVIELEGHVLQPFLLGKAVSIHPLAVLYGIAVGTIVGGIVGALFTVPVLAFGNAFLRAMSAPTTPVLVASAPDPDELEEFDE